MSGETFLNTYQAPKLDIPRGIHAETPLSEYDFNYCFDIKTLRSDRVELRPFLVRVLVPDWGGQSDIESPAIGSCQTSLGSITEESRSHSVVGQQAMDLPRRRARVGRDYCKAPFCKLAPCDLASAVLIPRVPSSTLYTPINQAQTLQRRTRKTISLLASWGRSHRQYPT